MLRAVCWLLRDFSSQRSKLLQAVMSSDVMGSVAGGDESAPPARMTQGLALGGARHFRRSHTSLRSPRICCVSSATQTLRAPARTSTGVSAVILWEGACTAEHISRARCHVC